jgi:hypothetical protein
LSSSVLQLIVLIHVIVLNINIKMKIVKLVKFLVTSDDVTKLFLSVKKAVLYIKY